MYPSVYEVKGGVATFQIHIPNISFQFDCYPNLRGACPANKTNLEMVDRLVRSGERLFKGKVASKLKAECNSYLSEFMKLAPNLPAVRIEYLCQVYLHQRLFRPEYEERQREISDGLAFFEGLKGNTDLCEYLSRILFAVPTGLLKNKVIAQITLMISQITQYMIRDEMISSRYTKDQTKATALGELWGKTISRKMLMLVLEKKKKGDEIKAIKDNLKDDSEFFELIYDCCTPDQLNLICSLYQTHPENLLAVFRNISKKADPDAGEFKSLDEVSLYTLTIKALRLQKDNPELPIEKHIEFGVADARRSKAHFSALLFLGATKLLGVSEISGSVADAIREVVISFSKIDVRFPEQEIEQLKAHFKSTGFEELKKLAAGNFRIDEGVAGEKEGLRKLLVSANEQILALTEEELDAFQKSLDKQQSKPKKPMPRRKTHGRESKKSHRAIEKPIAAKSSQPIPAGGGESTEGPPIESYVAEAFLSQSNSVLNIALTSLSEMEGEVQPSERVKELRQEINACVQNISHFERSTKLWKKPGFVALNSKVSDLQQQCDMILDAFFQSTRPLSPDEQDQAEFQQFCKAVQGHMRNQKMIQAHNRGGVLDICTRRSMWYDIRQYFHGHPLERYASVLFIRPDRELQANEALAYYVTRNSRTPGIQFCISVHLWRIKKNVAGDPLWLPDGRLNPECWEDQDRGLNTSYYVLHIPVPQ